ncbi:MAG: bifunctional serine/threonine-protein kinase/formylglycine-generating enzyme family protein, partial [Planctomycetota bacterium]
MAGNVSDEAFARYVNQIGIVTLDKLEAAKALQEENARKGTPLSLADVLVRQGVIPQDIRENIQKKIQAEEQGAMRQLGPYKLLKKLGEGGMGAVYLAEDTMAGRKVAVKVLPQKYSDEREFLTRFRREAQATGKLNHANIVTAYNVGEDSGTHYYAMEYCAGDTLDRILKREEYLPWDEAIAVTIQVARGLQHAHDHGIIHRDIKPANIFICSPLGSAGVPPAIGSAGVPPAIGSAGVSPAPSDAGGTPALPEGFIAKILDLGLSKNIGSNEQSYLTQTGAALGTPHYISPEQARGDKSIDGRTDIYSLGATLYHLVTGQTPFTGTTAGVVIAKHLSEQLPNPQDIRGDLPDGVVQVLQKMMAKDVADRYRDCGELLADLELLTQGRMPALAVVDAALSTIATPRRGAQAKATKPRVPRFGAAVVRKKAEPVPLEPLAETVVRKDAAVPHSAGLRKPRFGRKQYIAIGAAAVVLLGLIAALAFNRSETQNPKSEGNSETETAKSDAGIQPDPGTGKLEPAVAQAEALPKELSLDLGGGVKMDMVLIPAGEFMMDSRKQGGNLVKPGHKVQISQPFYIGKYDVTVAQFRAFADATKFRTDAETSNMGSTVKDGKSQELPGVNWRNPGFKQDDNHPACVVTWHDAQEFCKWATANHRDTETQRKWTVRLPTETEWQYAASGPQ